MTAAACIDPLSHLDPNAPICLTGKRPFRTEARAQAELRRARRVRANDPAGGRKPGLIEKRTYQCPLCSWFHLTHTAKHRKRS